MAQPQHGAHEDVLLPLLGLDVVVEEPLLEPEPGVVDEQVHRTRAVGESLLDRGELRRVGEVGGQHLDLDAVRRPQVGRYLLQPGGVPGDENQVVATGRELAGELMADPGGRAGDEGGRHAPK